MFVHCSTCGAEVNQLRPFQCPHCHTWHWRNPKPCGGALIEHDGRVLMLERDQDPWRGCWDIPGGFCEDGEHPADTAVREILEETGYHIELLGLLGLWSDRYHGTEPPATTLNIYYLAQTPDGGEPVLDPAEASGHRWFGPDEEIHPIGFPGHFPQVLDAWRAVRRGQRTLTPLPDDEFLRRHH